MKINYTIKPFHPATSEALPLEQIEAKSRRSELTLPDVSLPVAPLLPPAVPTMKKLALDKGAEWCRILREARPLMAKHSLKEVAFMVGTSAATLCRLLKDFEKVPTTDLSPERLAPAKGGGRECDWEFLLKDEAVKAKLLELYVATMGASSAAAANDRRTAKIATALKQFCYEPECPPKLRERLRAGYQPVPFVNLLRAAVTPEMEAKIRGPKHYQLYGPSSRRDWTCRLPDGNRFEFPASYSLSMDDMSANHPFYVDYKNGTIDDLGVILSRQGLYALWAKHKVWQSVELVARTRESYTAADILRAFYKMCLAMGGVPPFVEFEQGIWKAKKISGWKQDGEWLVEEVVQRPGMDTVQMNGITTGLGMCGVKVLYKTKAHQKHVETHFNPFQDILAIVARQFQCIGRYAGEFEHSGKQLRRIRAGSHHPRDLHFASQAELADCIAEAQRRINDQPSSTPGKTRYEAHWDDLGQVGLLPLTERLFAACLPGDFRKTTIRNGYVNIMSRGQEFQYRHEEFSKLGDGYELFYKFDDTDPNLGCAIFNRTSASNSANFQNWKPGEFMFCAPRELPGPKLDVTSAPAGVEIKSVEQRYGTGAVDRGDTLRKKQDKFVATQFRSMPRPGQIAIRSAAARDGRGNVAEITNVKPVSESQGEARGRNASCPAEALPPKARTAKPVQQPYQIRKLMEEHQAT